MSGKRKHGKDQDRYEDSCTVGEFSPSARRQRWKGGNDREDELYAMMVDLVRSQLAAQQRAGGCWFVQSTLVSSVLTLYMHIVLPPTNKPLRASMAMMCLSVRFADAGKHVHPQRQAGRVDAPAVSQPGSVPHRGHQRLDLSRTVQRKIERPD